jgi:14-3-3 protein epsilon
MTSFSRDDLIYLAKLAEQAEQHEDMLQYMNQVVDLGQDLSWEERNLLSVAYKNPVSTLRSAWRVLSTLQQREKERGNDHNSDLARRFRENIEKRLRDRCRDILSQLDKNLLPHAAQEESQVFFYKMAGDYNRYMAEFSAADEKQGASDAALKAYQKANEIAVASLPTTNPVRLGLALNFSVFYYEVLNQPDRACSLAQDAFDAAIGDMGTQQDEALKDSTLILQLLRDNLALWTDKADEKSDEEELEINDAEAK